MDHPIVVEIEKTGYPKSEQPKIWGFDYFGDEIFEGDSVIKDPSNGEIVLEENLEDYLIEVLGFEFKTAE
ncbi:YqaI family protein [Bacillus sp. 03113]|uniref:YqaI family protein n=1 Tax=Bacillus sp. 03113 TaxID=2578211 RepID=UPI00114259F8|nr:hypothetical protein [Bacillus sp. 03113]